ncbi:RluA family pseudouridine synthase [Desulfobotulus sp. H1]|uniref:RluA family pseudouridine synthase n=1 Tax=Desulfobotulus pelophilus TaxID=2823377 RepID=A0ABT3NAG8_9BACT|nr:RluA family pseudouridine synthase [Desulfobotulus pelophilus]MCW7754425.1 RluA family pseudouridine synthase [Desulfobotulus pelophilus]
MIEAMYEEAGVVVLFESEDLLIVDKPAGVAVIPERDKTAPCLLHKVETCCRNRLYVVHRLDKEVSGVLVFAKKAAAHRFLSMEFEHRRVQKNYLALVHGLPDKKTGSLRAPIRAFGSGRMGVDVLRGKESLTHWHQIGEYGDKALLDVFPVTGRRHQIRVHLYHMGYPIVGDLRYGDRGLQQEWERLMLHARHLTLPLPDGGSVHVKSPVPEAFSRLCNGYE